MKSIEWHPRPGLLSRRALAQAPPLKQPAICRVRRRPRAAWPWARSPCGPRSDRAGAAAAAAAAALGRAAPLGPPAAGVARAAAGGQGRGIGRPCFARWSGAHARPGQQGHARGRQLRGAGAGLARWLWARGLRPQHDNTTKARPVVARAPNGHGRGLVLGFTCTGQGPEGPPCRWRAVLVEGERPAAGVAGGGPRALSIQPPCALMGPSMGPELGVYGGLTGLLMRSHWPHPTVVVSSEIFIRKFRLELFRNFRKFALTFQSQRFQNLKRVFGGGLYIPQGP